LQIACRLVGTKWVKLKSLLIYKFREIYSRNHGN